MRGRLVVVAASTPTRSRTRCWWPWDTLRGWLSATSSGAAASNGSSAPPASGIGSARRARLCGATKQLAEASVAGPPPADTREAAFLASSRRAARRRRVARWAAAIGVPVVALGIYAISSVHHRRELARQISAAVTEAEAAVARARSATAAFDRLRGEAFARFDAMDGPAGEERWAQALASARQAAEAERAASDAFEMALRLDAGRSDLRARFGDVLAERARLAELTYQRDQRDEILARLALNDEDGSRRARWNALGEIELVVPRGVSVQLFRYQDDQGRRKPVLQPPITPPHLALAPGSYLLVAGETRLPLLVGRGEHRRVELNLPRPGSIPEGFVYIPAGRFIYGSSGNEALRREFFNAPPLHSVDTGAYLIARNETTYGDWVAFLDALSPAERARHMAAGSDLDGVGVELRQQDGAWRLAMRTRAAVYHARWGELIRYRDRPQRSAQDWRRMPVAGVTFHDAEAYARWLASTGQVPGARLCSEMEWERAARGADDREFPHGDRLDPDDANFDFTYGQKINAFGPDEVGQHPISRSPFGIDDMSGNIFEWTRSSRIKDEATIRGGCYYYSREMVRVHYRESMNADDRTQMIGIRLCSDLPRDTP